MSLDKPYLRFRKSREREISSREKPHIASQLSVSNLKYCAISL